ncbi:hypothetical protein NBO_41g0018 [Nosema bombycis CQ1]|uniref:Uncharacterized protein n=1 Tax=Nosema bombycis (strain CQ1 / CVCC 102059) TaxID=578461 RepID=R0KV00_NOSB1|nr:hypothetical protein NBO_41g0018 [Nosema bombycis CQ1]|eukprot:EOB14042.1 hypothetical protein NBO_41g0018 [Nosema bombycis CQ1]
MKNVSMSVHFPLQTSLYPPPSPLLKYSILFFKFFFSFTSLRHSSKIFIPFTKLSKSFLFFALSLFLFFIK